VVFVHSSGLWCWHVPRQYVSLIVTVEEVSKECALISGTTSLSSLGTRVDTGISFSKIRPSRHCGRAASSHHVQMFEHQMNTSRIGRRRKEYDVAPFRAGSESPEAVREPSCA